MVRPPLRTTTAFSAQVYASDWNLSFSQVGRVGVGSQRPGRQPEHPIADHQDVDLADPQRVARRNQLVGPRSTGV
jgi:hypothetical protein